MRLERLLSASGFNMTSSLRRLLKQHVNGNTRHYRWVVAGPALFLRWSFDLIEPAFLLNVRSDSDSWDGLDVSLSVHDPRTFEQTDFFGYNGSGDKKGLRFG